MLVFLSWSGEQSKQVAQTLASWLSQVIQSVEPWISVELEKGKRWGPEITAKLQASKVGIVCLTPDNLSSPWLLFEAGAISNTKEAHVCTFLVGVKPTDVKQPLGQFQHTSFERSDVRRLLGTINQQVQLANERALPDRTLDEVFEFNWLRLETAIAKVQSTPLVIDPNDRSEKELLQEALELLREQERRRQDAEAKAKRDAATNTLLLSELGARTTAADFARLGLSAGLLGLPVNPSAKGRGLLDIGPSDTEK